MAVAHGGGLHDRAQRCDRTPTAADHLPCLVIGDVDLEHDGAVLLVEALDRDLLRLVDERPGEVLEQPSTRASGG